MRLSSPASPRDSVGEGREPRDEVLDDNKANTEGGSSPVYRGGAAEGGGAESFRVPIAE